MPLVTSELRPGDPSDPNTAFFQDFLGSFSPDVFRFFCLRSSYRSGKQSHLGIHASWRRGVWRSMAVTLELSGLRQEDCRELRAGLGHIVSSGPAQVTHREPSLSLTIPNGLGSTGLEDSRTQAHSELCPGSGR